MATRSSSTTSRCRSCTERRSAWSGPTAPASRRCSRSWPASTAPTTATRSSTPGATVGMLQQEPPLSEGAHRPGERRGGGPRDQGQARPLQRDLRGARRPRRRLRQAPRRDGRPADRPRPRQRVGPRQPARPGHGRAALPAAGRAGRQPLRWRAPPRRAVQAAAPAARPAAARRAHQPPRRRVRAVARGPPRGLPGRRPGRHPRPVLPRQRRAVDPRARPRQGAPLRGQLLDLPRDQAGPAQDRGPEGRQARQDAGEGAGVGPLQPQGPAGEEQVAARALRGDGGRGRPDAQDRHLRDQHPGRSAARRHRAGGRRPRQGLRRPAADPRPRLQAAPRRHRRRDRSQRRRQDHAVPDDRRRGEARRGRAQGRPDRQDLLRRPEPRRPRPHRRTSGRSSPTGSTSSRSPTSR